MVGERSVCTSRYPPLLVDLTYWTVLVIRRPTLFNESCPSSTYWSVDCRNRHRLDNVWSWLCKAYGLSSSLCCPSQWLLSPSWLSLCLENRLPFRTHSLDTLPSRQIVRWPLFCELLCILNDSLTCLTQALWITLKTTTAHSLVD